MNYLAHLYLSYDNKDVMIGNFIADHVKGNKYSNFRSEIQKGIIFHREIDSYTDSHEIVRKSKRRLNKRYRHYNSVIIDIFFDYFLAKNWNNYSEIPLDIYSKSVNSFFNKISNQLPLQSQQFIKYMTEYNILFNYQYKNGIQKVLNGMNYRTNGKSQMNLAIEDLEKFEVEFAKDFKIFFQDLILFSNNKIKEI